MLEQTTQTTRETAPFGEQDAAELVERLRRTFREGRTRPVEWRRKQLMALRRMVTEREAVLHDALRNDLGKPGFEAFVTETGFVTGEIDYVLKHLDRWMRPDKAHTPLAHQPAKSYVQPEPLGVALIIAPWNYPVGLVLSPLVGALAAGNCAVIKPSEIAPHTAAAVAEWIPKYLDDEAVAVVQGAVPETQALLAQQFDHVFYTGNETVGRIVMEAAAKHLTPVTLELGGKSPTIVDRSADLDVAARRIVWGKYINAGQTCVAPDYVLVDQSVEQPLIQRIVATIREFYGDDPKQSPDYARIVNERHFDRLHELLDDGELVVGGGVNRQERYIAPTVMRNVSDGSKIMKDEIFGPILPIRPVADVDAAIDEVNSRPKPLALYVFTGDKTVANKVLQNTSSGGACVNETITHLAVLDMPFGGVGNSGMGAYHGRHSFETFSHYKAVLDKPTLVDPKLRYPPYEDKKLKMARRLM
jgi:aldehyde dehydrogenase (NAD+)